jgi:SPP1 family predicted phage head-tail adaptor
LVFQAKPVPEDQDSFGAPVEDWQDAFTVWGAFEPLGGQEFPAFLKRFAETTARFRIRFRAGIDPDKHRIKLTIAGIVSIWDIQPPLPVDGRKVEMHIEAREIK